MALPNTYQRLEYIKSTGAQYIDSGVTGIIGYKVRYCFDEIANNTTIFGDYDGTGHYRTFLMNYDNWLHECPSWATYGYVDTNIHTMEYRDTKLYLDGAEVCSNIETSWGSSTHNLYIFAGNSGNVPTQYSRAKIYELKFYKDTPTNCVRDFIPCYRKSDKVAGLYDDINGVFYTNQGYTYFIKGPEVYSEIITNFLYENNTGFIQDIASHAIVKKGAGFDYGLANCEAAGYNCPSYSLSEMIAKPYHYSFKPNGYKVNDAQLELAAKGTRVMANWPSSNSHVILTTAGKTFTDYFVRVNMTRYNASFTSSAYPLYLSKNSNGDPVLNIGSTQIQESNFTLGKMPRILGIAKVGFGGGVYYPGQSWSQYRNGGSGAGGAIFLIDLGTVENPKYWFFTLTKPTSDNADEVDYVARTDLSGINRLINNKGTTYSDFYDWGDFRWALMGDNPVYVRVYHGENGRMSNDPTKTTIIGASFAGYNSSESSISRYAYKNEMNDCYTPVYAIGENEPCLIVQSLVGGGTAGGQNANGTGVSHNGYFGYSGETGSSIISSFSGGTGNSTRGGGGASLLGKGANQASPLDYGYGGGASGTYSSSKTGGPSNLGGDSYQIFFEAY